MTIKFVSELPPRRNGGNRKLDSVRLELLDNLGQWAEIRRKPLDLQGLNALTRGGSNIKHSKLGEFEYSVRQVSDTEYALFARAIKKNT